jgi:hypothetical protein
MKTWLSILKEVERALNKYERQGCPDPYFRGHRLERWTLRPSLIRKRIDALTESRLYYQFKSLGGHLMTDSATSWDCLFLMQHHGLPTRLLDWTETFGMALYFALKNARADVAVWILNPYLLNEESAGDAAVLHLNTDYPAGYADYFANERSKLFNGFPHDVIAVSGNPRVERMRSQKAVFTLHARSSKSLDRLYPGALTKIRIPLRAHKAARQFLRLSGITEYAAFPDRDGLARYIAEIELG